MIASTQGWLTPPFGPLNHIHNIALQAKPLTWQPDVLFVAFVLPVLPMLVQAWLLLREQSTASRITRRALAGVAVMLTWKAWVGYRLVDPAYNAFNTGVTMYHLHMAIKAIEFGLLNDQIIDPWIAKGRTSLQATADLIINTRMIFLGDVGLDKGTNKPNALITEPKVERHLRHLQNPPQSRGAAIARHLTTLIVLYVFDHICFSFLRTPHISQLGVIGDGMLTTFVNNTAVHIPFLGVLAPWSLRLWVQLVVFFIILASLSIMYHSAAVTALLLGWEVETWSVDLMHRPWAADSLINMWGKRWHQVLRHHFTILSSAICQFLHLPEISITMLPLAFFLSGVMHVLGELNMSPPPTPWKIGSFFFLNGLGCILEGLFRSITGRRVRGPLGHIWFLTSLFATSRLACEAWLDAGMGGCTLLPERGPGELVAPWILKNVISVTARS